ncbi:amidase family protein [Streptomyces sp. O3]
MNTPPTSSLSPPSAPPAAEDAVRAFLGRTDDAPSADPLPDPLPGPLPEPLTLPLAERHRLLATGELSADEWREQAAAWALRADRRYRATVELREPADTALRLGVKDTVDVRGFATRLGLRRYRHHPRESAAVLAPLRHATVNAKVVTTELNIGIGSGCVNPYFPRIDPAGSSTGSGVAVAGNICDVSLGTDVLGSVRWPAGRCGVVGLRTTHDPRRLPGVFPLSPSMDAAGWVARTADDLAFAWRHMGLGEPGTAGTRLRIGIPRELRRAGLVDQEVADCLDRTAALLRESGHTVSDAALGEIWECRGQAWELCARDAWDGYQLWRSHIDDDLLDSTRAALEGGAKVSDERYADIRRRQLRIRAASSALFAEQSVDAWLLPLDPGVPAVRGTVPAAASTIPEPGDPQYEREIGFTPVASFAGLPAITFPAAVSDASGAPVAMQLVGGRGAEGSLIRAAQDAAAALGDLGLRPRGPRA